MSKQRTWAIVALLLLVGLALRGRELGALSVHGDEIITIHNAQNGLRAAAELDAGDRWQLDWSWSTMPLLQLETELAFRALGSSALAARLPSFLSGALALVLLPLLVARLWTVRAGLFALLLLALSPRHIEMCRMARYESSAFLFGGLAILGVVLFLETRRWPWVVLGVGSGLLALASHLSALPLLSTLLFCCLVFSGRAVRVRAAVAAVLVLAAILAWPAMRQVFDVVVFHVERGPVGDPAWKIAGSIAYNSGPLVVMLALVAIAAMRGKRDVTRVVLAASAVVPFVGLALGSVWKDVGPRYYASAEPALVLLAVVPLAHAMIRVPGWALGALLVLGAIQLQLLASNQIDGQRYDYAAMGAEVKRVTTDADLVFSKNHGTLEYYADRETVEVPDTVAELERAIRDSREARVFLVLPWQRGHAVYPHDPDGIEAWLRSNAERIARFGKRRIDDLLYRFEIALYRIDAEGLRP